jgi:tRNA threonylcarbamoyl adenosine modification protein YeaZ
MFTLFIDTHGETISVALYDGKELFLKTQESEYSHAVYLAPMIKTILEENNLSVKDLKNIVAVNGPGSFTGLRIGLSEAKTLAYLLNVSIYLISSLTSYLVSDDSECNKTCIMEENKGYYVSVFDKDNNSIMEETFVEDINDFSLNYIVPMKLDVVKVINFALRFEPVNAHLVRANYVKTIEVLK